MKYRNYLMTFIAIFTFTLMSEAKEIYESKNKQGEVEFTDQSSPGAQVVNLEKPNIADAVDSQQPTQDKLEIKKTTKPVEPEVLYRGTVGDDDINPKRVHREQQIEQRRNDRLEDRVEPRDDYQQSREGQRDTQHPKENRDNGQKKTQHKRATHQGGR